MGGLVTICLMGIIGTVSFSPQAAGASWSDSGYAKATYGALVVNPASNLPCDAGLLTRVTFNWAAPPTPSLDNQGTETSGYFWTLKTLGGTSIDEGSLAASATSITFSRTGLLALGVTYAFALVALGPSPWKSTAVNGTVSFIGALGVVVRTTCTVS